MKTEKEIKEKLVAHEHAVLELKEEFCMKGYLNPSDKEKLNGSECFVIALKWVLENE